jgi:hypothetical protein
MVQRYVREAELFTEADGRRLKDQRLGCGWNTRLSSATPSIESLRSVLSSTAGPAVCALSPSQRCSEGNPHPLSRPLALARVAGGKSSTRADIGLRAIGSEEAIIGHVR